MKIDLSGMKDFKFDGIKYNYDEQSFENVIDRQKMEIYENYIKKEENNFLLDMTIHNAKQIATLLDNQKIYYNSFPDMPQQDKVYLNKIVKEVWTNNLIFNLVNVETSLSPATLVYYKKFRYNEVESEPVMMVTRMLKVVAKNRDNAFTDILIDEFRNEIVREVVADIRNNAGTIDTYNFTNTAGLRLKIWEVSEVVKKKTMRSGFKWIVTSNKIASNFFDKEESTKIEKVGTLFDDACDVYVDPLMPAGQIVGGTGNEGMMGSYFYCPYLLNLSETMFSPDTVDPFNKFFHRYGKKLCVGGARHFGRINVTFPI